MAKEKDSRKLDELSTPFWVTWLNDLTRYLIFGFLVGSEIYQQTTY